MTRTDRLESFNAGNIIFIAEQHGDVETDLKVRLTERFKSNIHVIEAYLVQVRYTNSPAVKIALCLKTDPGAREEIVGVVGSEFRKMFQTSESLDIVFLSPQQENTISLIAKPFFKQPLIQN